jgi:uncharacterized membrane protein YeaQ/YmgE (transglycosylase-associated protein family)
MPLILIVLLVIALLVVGWWVIGLTLSLLWFLLVGLVVGALARLVLPGQQDLGILATMLYGVGGSLIGGLLARAFDVGGLLQFVLAVAAAAVLIAVFAGTRSATRTA